MLLNKEADRTLPLLPLQSDGIGEFNTCGNLKSWQLQSYL